MFNNIHFVFEMETMKRFTVPVLITILQEMRQPKGAKLTDQEWQALAGRLHQCGQRDQKVYVEFCDGE